MGDFSQGIPLASQSNLLASTPTLAHSLKSSATAVETQTTANQAAGTTGAGVAGAGLLGFDGTNWQTVSLTALLADAIANNAFKFLTTANFGSIYNGTTWDRMRGVTAAHATTGTGLLGVGTLIWDSNTNSYIRIQSMRVFGDGETGGGFAPQGLMLFNGTTYDRARNCSAANMAATTQPFSLKIDSPGQWSQAHTPVAGTQATTSKAAGAAGVRHLCNSISFSIGDAAAIAAVQVNLRDGASGAGTILWSMTIFAPANSFVHAELSDLNIIGSAATAMTLEFSAAPAGTGIQSVAMTGHSVA